MPVLCHVMSLRFSAFSSICIIPLPLTLQDKNTCVHSHSIMHICPTTIHYIFCVNPCSVLLSTVTKVQRLFVNSWRDRRWTTKARVKWSFVAKDVGVVHGRSATTQPAVLGSVRARVHDGWCWIPSGRFCVWMVWDFSLWRQSDQPWPAWRLSWPVGSIMLEAAWRCHKSVVWHT